MKGVAHCGYVMIAELIVCQFFLDQDAKLKIEST